MTPATKWIELLICKKCGRSGLVQLSQPEGSTYGMRVDAMPEGFKVANHELGEAFFCEACTHPAATSCPDKR
jgi:transcription elongation factor Elf1